MCVTLANFPQREVITAGFDPDLHTDGGMAYPFNFGTIADPRTGSSLDGGQSDFGFELYYFNNATLGNYVMAETTYTNCDYCVYMDLGCDTQGNCAHSFLAMAGSVDVSRADQSPDGGRFTTSMTDLNFVEWDFGADESIDGGLCYIVTNASVDVAWRNPADGGDLEVLMGDGGPP